MIKKGYILNKSNFDDCDINCIKADLVVRTIDESYNVFREDEDHLYVPKFYAINKFSIPYQKMDNSGDNINTSFIIDLRDAQKPIINKIYNAYKHQGGGILTLPCGFGKTIIALYFIALLKKKTLIIVHREFLITHWEEKIKSSLSDVKIGLIQGNNINIHECDIVIVMLQTLALKDFPETFFDSFGHIIIDECHRVPTGVFSNVLFKINSNYMLGLSATPNRQDGMTKVLKWHIGDIIDLNVKIETKLNMDVKRYVLNFNKDIFPDGNFSTKLSSILKHDLRNNIIINTILDEYKTNNNRQFLILSDRLVHLKDLYNILKRNNVSSIGYIIGGMTKSDLILSEKCTFILATYSMVNEGLDIPLLNCLVFASPKIEIEQAIGRISRLNNNEFNPLVIDFIDTLLIFIQEARKRLNHYLKKKYTVSDYIYNSNTKIFERNMSIHDDYSMYSLKTYVEIDTEYNDISKEGYKKISVKKPVNSSINSSVEESFDSLFKSFNM
jgi:superfamily II DNA or RNA helicase